MSGLEGEVEEGAGGSPVEVPVTTPKVVRRRSDDDLQEQDDPPQKKRTPNKAKPPAELCVICRDPQVARAAKSKFCDPCRKEVAACKKDAERNDTIDIFNEK